MKKATNKNKKSFVSVHEYAKANNLKRQNVYRWIREHKFNDGDIATITKKVTRIVIKLNAKPKKYEPQTNAN